MVNTIGKFCAAVLVIISLVAQANEKSDLSVLYVGPKPDSNERFFPGGDREIFKQVVNGQFEDYTQFLPKYFKKVKAIYGHQYTETLSHEYDVTIFDAFPPELAPAVMAEEGWLKKPPTYLSPGFDRPALVMSSNSANLVHSLNTKIDSLCHCLHGHAHHLKENHPVFNTPHKVALNYQRVATPANYSNYYSGRSLEESIPGWQVSKGLLTGKRVTAGLVCSPGFEDYPDGETIASGLNHKSVDSVAIGRHGNFLHWGFWGSPKYWTEPAQKAFVNAIHYIQSFGGQHPVMARTDLPKTQALDVALRLHSDKIQRDLDGLRAQQAQVRAKQARGESLTRSEKKLLGATIDSNYIAYTQNIWFRQIPDEMKQRFGDDHNQFLSYYLENYDYLRPRETGSFTFVVDADVKALGKANNDPRLLEACIEQWKQGQHVERAKRLLARYTDQEFETVAEWEQWYSAHRGELIFTEVGGYKFSPLKPGLIAKGAYLGE